MRHLWNCGRLVTLTLFGLAGCLHGSSQPDLKPNLPEEYKVPPPGLYAKPVDYPKEYMNQGPGRKDISPDDVAPVNPGMQQRMGAPGRPY